MSPLKERKSEKPPVSSLVSQVHDEHFSVYQSGILGYMKFMQQNHKNYSYNLAKIQKILFKSDTKRTDLKRTLIGHPKVETLGFKLEKSENFKFDLPVTGNNYYKNHSQIGHKHIYRNFKGPLYNEAGRICIELT